MDSLIDAVVINGLKTLFLMTAPIVVVVGLAGVLVSALQAAMSIHDPASSYAVRLVALIAAVYFIFPSCAQYLISLAQLAFR